MYLNHKQQKLLNNILQQVELCKLNKPELRYYCRLQSICSKPITKQYTKRQIQDLFM